MNISKTLNFYANVIIHETDANGDNGRDVVVAILTATVGENQLSHVINTNIVNKELIEKTADNKLLYRSQYNEFVQVVQSNLQ